MRGIQKHAHKGSTVCLNKIHPKQVVMIEGQIEALLSE
jgi:hypothetical protein